MVPRRRARYRHDQATRSRPRLHSASASLPVHANAGPQLTAIAVCGHGQFAYVSGQLPDGTSLPRYGSATPIRPAPGFRRLPGQPPRLREIHPGQRIPRAATCAAATGPARCVARKFSPLRPGARSSTCRWRCVACYGPERRDRGRHVAHS